VERDYRNNAESDMLAKNDPRPVQLLGFSAQALHIVTVDPVVVQVQCFAMREVNWIVEDLAYCQKALQWLHWVQADSLNQIESQLVSAAGTGRIARVKK
jgi:hypothetical protein